MRRREFIAGLGGTAGWPLNARAQQADRVRRIGVLLPGDENDPTYERIVSTFTQALAGLGWTDGRNVRIDYRWGSGNVVIIRKSAAELATLAPDVILAGGGASMVGPLLQATRTVPIVFTYPSDPIGAGFVDIR